MKNQLKTYLAPYFSLYLDEGEGEDKEKPPVEKTFTQEEVNGFLAKNRQKLQAELVSKTTALAEAQSSLNLSSEEMETLTSKVEELESSLMTDKEIAARDKKKAEKAYSESLDKSTKEAAKWKGLYDTGLVQTAITQASLKKGQKAINPAQLVSLFSKDATVTANDDGTFGVQIAVETLGADGKKTTLKLDPEAAIKEYASKPEYENLFVDESKNGLGRKRTHGLAKGELPTTLAEYKANRKELIQQ